MPDPQIGKPVVGPRTFLTVRAFLWFNCSAAVGRLLGSSIVGPMATSSNRAYATCSMTHICCGQSPCPCSRPLLIHASTGDALKRRSGSVSVGSLGPGAPKVLSEPSKRLWQIWGLILNAILPLAPWKKIYDQPRQHIKKQKHNFANKGLSSQSYCFSSGHVWMTELDHKES